MSKETLEPWGRWTREARKDTEEGSGQWLGG